MAARSARLAWLTARVLGARILALLAVSALLYSTVAAYVEATVAGLTGFYREDIGAPEGLAVLSVYSGLASTPFTGILPGDTLSKLEGSPGVVESWGEVAVPSLVEGEPLVVRGLPPSVLDSMAWRVDGEPLAPGDYAGALIGYKVAERLGVGPGDVVVVEPLFTRAQAALVVRGILWAPSPYDSEVIVSLPTAQALRGHRGYTVVRVVYDPSETGPRELASRLGVELGSLPRALVEQLVLLAARGYAELGDPSRLQGYYTERLGIPRELVLAVAVASDSLLALLMVPLAWAAAALRSGELSSLVEQGLRVGSVKLYLLASSLPAVASGVALGALLAAALPGARILGYTLPSTPEPPLLALHIAVYTALYGVGAASARIGG